MKQFILIMCILILQNEVIAQCNAPTNQPSELTLTESPQTISGTFLPAGLGTHIADAYLVLISKSASLDQPPVNGTLLKVGDDRGNAKVIAIGSETSFKASNLEGGVLYHVFVFSYSNTGICYNLISPLTKSATAGATTAPPNNNGGNNNTPSKAQKTSKLQPLMDFNFAGKKNSWSNLTPVIFYGWSISAPTKAKKSGKALHLWDNTFQVGPYVGTTIALKDSTSFLPSLMLPGNAGLQMNYFMTFGNEKKFSIVFSPLNLGLKVISGYTDSSISIVQHSIRHFLGFRYADFITVSVQYTRGWHNLSSYSEENFEKLFKRGDNSVAYWTVGLTTRLSEDLFPDETKTPVYLNVNWRSLDKPTDKFNLPNSKIITVGIATNINLKSGSNSGAIPKHPF